MPDVTMYATKYCPYCMRARALLKDKEVEYTEIDVDAKPRERVVMRERTGRTSVPQIFIGETHVGGCDDLYALHKAGELDALLGR